jgi:methylated-DNA-[protein]-cysteine S-methyltransferase
MTPTFRPTACAPHLIAQTTLSTPLGDALLACSDRGLCGLWFEGQKDHPGELPAPETPQSPVLRDTATQLADYFAGQRRRFELPLDLHGTPFQRRVWQLLCDIGCGEHRRYGELAQALGTPNAARAVGAAVGRNPVSVIVPCHRVLGQGGALTGYAGGLDRKVALLTLEGVWPPTAPNTGAQPRQPHAQLSLETLA